ncbi:tRNA 2'-phosphotransferase [Knufia peltigerae]|uniref:2'-phosphotransferase n=1 Tax=Knufia peltigerae TaxID=1002370 RepID=A0AA38YEI9_9EURO|nr:tRNA 2'-phosphotransferase [Knufia peltigerae]
MPRSEERSSHRGGGGGGRGGGGAAAKQHHRNNRNGPLPRQVLVSKALSRLLRHAAAQERVPIDNHGYVRMDHLLDWQRLKSMQPRVTFEEVVDVVLENEKKRFSLKYVGDDDQDQGEQQQRAQQQQEDTETQTETETQRAISEYETLKNTGGGQLDTRQSQRFYIRATQGHSMATVEAENLLTPITLDDPASVPDTVVHGTFYGSWEAILSSGGLKKMNRNHVHFATGPKYQDVMDGIGQGHHDVKNDTKGGTTEGDGDGKSADRDGQDKGGGNSRGGSNETLLQKNKVISGMRSDAQILVYVDIRRALVEQPDMKWWRSENGVVLTDGVAVTTKKEEEEEDDAQKQQTPSQNDKVVPTKYFTAAVEIKQGLGLLYEDGKGVVNQLPERLRTRGVPRGKGGPRGRGGRGGGRG